MSSKLSPVVRNKVAKLLPLLSSDRDGERVGTVAAIDRVLKSEKLDWHDLAAQITAEPAVQMPDEINSDNLIDLIEEIRASGVTFSTSSKGFLNSLAGRARIYDAVFLSRKQQHWLANLAAKARAELP